MLVHEKDGSWSMCFDCQAFNNILIHEEARFNKGQRVEQYERQAYEGYQRLVFDPKGWIRLHLIPSPRNFYRFKFFNFWADDPTFLDLVQHAWNIDIYGTPMYRLSRKFFFFFG